MSATASAAEFVDPDEAELAALGYKQELNRSWSSFSNFAISFSIISILAGCFTSFGLGWNGGGPAAIAWGWPVVSALILVIGLCMSELVSAMPTSGGIYWWAAKLGGPKAGYYTGWLNLIGLLAIDASVAYGCATFFDTVVGNYSSSWAADYSLDRVFIEFVIILAIAAAVNIFSSHLLAVLNNMSVWWHVAGALAVIAILLLVPSHHASVASVFTHTVNNTGFFGGKTSGAGFIFLVLPLSAILTQYTITGYDASAHLSEETKSAANGAAKGIWRSIFYSALGGWVLLLAFLFAVQDEAGVTKAGGASTAIFAQALSSNWGGVVLIISTAGQFFCTVACMTSTSRMMFAFSRDRAVPGAQVLVAPHPERVPVYGVIASAVIAVVLTLPALVKVDINGAPVPVAFFAVVSIGVVGLYLAFAIPIYCRWKAGTAFKVGRWTLGKKYRWMAPLAVAEIAVTSIVAMFPTSTGGPRGTTALPGSSSTTRRWWSSGCSSFSGRVAVVGEELVHRASDDLRDPAGGGHRQALTNAFVRGQVRVAGSRHARTILSARRMCRAVTGRLTCCVGTDVREDGVEGDAQGRGVAAGLGQQQAALQRGEQGEREGVGVGVRAQLAPGPHAGEAVADRRLPSLEACGEVGSGVRVVVGEFGRDGSDRAAAGAVPLLLQVDQQVAPAFERGEAVELVEHRSLRGQHAVGLVGDDGADEVVLVGEVVIHLRRADTGPPLDVLDAGAGDTVGEHQLGSGGDDARPGRQALGGERPDRAGAAPRTRPAGCGLLGSARRCWLMHSPAYAFGVDTPNSRALVWSVHSNTREVLMTTR